MALTCEISRSRSRFRSFPVYWMIRACLKLFFPSIVFSLRYPDVRQAPIDKQADGSRAWDTVRGGPEFDAFKHLYGEAIEDWAVEQSPKLTLSKAVRYLAQRGLAAARLDNQVAANRAAGTKRKGK